MCYSMVFSIDIYHPKLTSSVWNGYGICQEDKSAGSGEDTADSFWCVCVCGSYLNRAWNEGRRWDVGMCRKKCPDGRGSTEPGGRNTGLCLRKTKTIENRLRSPGEETFSARDCRDHVENYLVQCPAHSRCSVHKTCSSYSFHCCSHLFPRYQTLVPFASPQRQVQCIVLYPESY